MHQQLGHVVLECLSDLGVTVVYAVVVAVLIVAIVASDQGVDSILKTGLLAALLPATACAMIALEIAVRVLGERRAMPRTRSFGPRRAA